MARRIFISWADQYGKEIAKQIRRYFDAYSPHVSAFFSDRDIEQGAGWRESLVRELNVADDSFAIFSQEAPVSPWFIYEASALSAKLNKLNIFTLGAPEVMVPPSLQFHQSKPMEYHALSSYLENTTSTSGATPDPARTDETCKRVMAIVDRYLETHVSPEAARWADASYRALTIYRQEKSPYDLENVIKVAHESIYLLAQNHYYMTERSKRGARERVWQLLTDKLRSGVDVQIVAMHPRTSFNGTPGQLPCDVWQAYMAAPKFLEHLRECWTTLSEWWTEYRKGSFSGNLAILGAFFLPISINIIDPDRDEGFIIMSQRIAQEANASRPQLIFSRKYEPKVFEFYWHWLNNSNANASWEGIEALGPHVAEF